MNRCAFGRNLCTRDGGSGPFGNFCPEHAAYLLRIGVALKMRKDPHDKEAMAKQEREREEIAHRIARIVWDSDEPVEKVHKALGRSDTSPAFIEARELAKQRGWVRVRPGKGYVKGDVEPEAPAPQPDALGRLPRIERAKRLAKFVHDQNRLVSRKEAAEALGLSPRGSFGRIVKAAKDQGWIESKVGGGGGYSPGRVVPA